MSASQAARFWAQSHYAAKVTFVENPTLETYEMMRTAEKAEAQSALSAQKEAA